MLPLNENTLFSDGEKFPLKKFKFIVLFHVLLDLKRVFWSDESLTKAFVTVNLIA